MNEPWLDMTCKDCAYWVKVPIDPSNITPDRPGACREQPHLVQMPQPRGMALVAVHLQVPADFPACGRFKAALRIVEGE